ncbi:Carboxylesterase NlhH [Caulifigura coniformis]|uniref:Carboxylesterase NlhH n=1 Tax=Caulifigura coniformis TaxID=2527983 RepID=A0A517SAI2_9PLAN|nr:alpha/beta hydrolase [Caulifigura coniformis]QDT53129.1 Carboxylesterase NlhH [Caulifigura coniformis]
MLRSVAVILSVAVCSAAHAAPPALPDGFKAVNDLTYAGNENPRQRLNLYVPVEKPAELLPVVVYIHGGGWEGGSKDAADVLSAFLKSGRVAGASVGYRLTNEAHWPSQAHDCKAALRWIHRHGAEYGIDVERIALFGISAGGHLVSLLGTTIGNAELEGEIGEPATSPVRFRCVANFCGPANFLTFESQGSVISGERPGPVMKLFDGKVSERQEAAKAASPELHVSSDDPPFLHIHGTKDPLVPYAQAVAFDKALDAVGVSSTLLTGEEGNHVFSSHQLRETINVFFDRHLHGQDVGIEQGPVAISDKAK